MNIQHMDKRFIMHYIADTLKPIFITAITWAYAFFNNHIIAVVLSVTPEEKYPNFDVLIYFIIKTSSAVSAIFGAGYIVYRFFVFHKRNKKQ